jgi:hypothetical protein
MRSVDSRKRTLDSSFDHAFLEFVGERAARQLHGFIERMDAANPVSTVTDAVDVNGAKDGLQGPAPKTAVGVDEGGGLFCDAPSRADITVAPLLDVSLEEQSLQVTSLELLLALDLMKGKLQGGWGRKPSLEGRELLPCVGGGGICQGDNRAGRARRREEGMRQAGWERSEWCGADHCPTVIYTVGLP